MSKKDKDIKKNTQPISIFVTVDSDLKEENIIQINNVDKMNSLNELL